MRPSPHQWWTGRAGGTFCDSGTIRAVISFLPGLSFRWLIMFDRPERMPEEDLVIVRGACALRLQLWIRLFRWDGGYSDPWAWQDLNVWRSL